MANEHFGPNRHFGNDEHWDRWGIGRKWAIGANGHLRPMDIGASGPWGQMGIRKNEHQSKWALGNGGK